MVSFFECHTDVIETALQKFRADLGLRLKKLFSVLHVKTHLTCAGIRKREGFSPVNLLFVLTNSVFLQILTLHDLLHRPFQALLQARKDTFYRFNQAEWSWRPFHRRFLAYLGRSLRWSRTRADNCLILDTTVLPKRGKTRENLSLVYDHSQGKTVPGYEVLTLGLLTPRNFWPVDFDFCFSRAIPKGAGEASPLKTRGELARRLQASKEFTKPELALTMLQAALVQGIPVPYLLVDARFSSLKFCQALKDLGLQIIGSPKRETTLYYQAGVGYTIKQLYQAHQHLLIKVEALGLSLLRVPVTYCNGLKGAIVLTKGYKEPDPEARMGRKIKPEPSWTAFFTTDLTLTAIQVVQKYVDRRSIEVFFKEAKQRLGLGQEQGHSFAGQVFSVLCACFRYSLLAYLLEQDYQARTIGDLFRQVEEETGKLTFLSRLWQHFAIFLHTVLNALADFCDPGPRFRTCLDVITNSYNQFSPIQGCET